MRGRVNFLIMTAIIGLLILFSCVFVIREGENGMLVRLGELVTDDAGNVIVYKPGLHFKYPFIQSIIKLDIRLQTLMNKSERIITKKKKDLLVDSYVKWRIEDVPKYYRATLGQRSRAEAFLGNIVTTGVRDQFGQREISEVVSDVRDELMFILQKTVDKRADSLGINVVDVRIKRIDLPDAVRDSVYQRMRTERQKIANIHRADGRAESEKIRADGDRKVFVILAEADKYARQTIGQAQAKAAKIYADAYSQDAEFYTFYRSLLAYSDAFTSKSDVLLIRPDGEFFKYFNQSNKTAKAPVG